MGGLFSAAELGFGFLVGAGYYVGTLTCLFSGTTQLS